MDGAELVLIERLVAEHVLDVVVHEGDVARGVGVLDLRHCTHRVAEALHGQARARHKRECYKHEHRYRKLSRVPLRKWLATTVQPDIPSSECSARGAWPLQLVAPPGSQR